MKPIFSKKWNFTSATRAEREVDSGDEQSVLKAQSEKGLEPRDNTESENDGSKSAPELDEPGRQIHSPDASKIGLTKILLRNIYTHI